MHWLYIFIFALYFQFKAITTQNNYASISEEKRIRKDTNISNHVQSFSFFLKNKSEFMINASEYYDRRKAFTNNTREISIKMQIYVYWKNQLVHSLPREDPKQRVRLVIYHGKTDIVEDVDFYYTYGITIKHKLQKQGQIATKSRKTQKDEEIYRLVIISTGEKIKFIQINLEKPYINFEEFSKKLEPMEFSSIKDSIKSISEELEQIGAQYTAFSFVDFPLYSQQLLANIQSFTHFLIVQIISVLALIFLQYLYIHKTLNKDAPLL